MPRELLMRVEGGQGLTSLLTAADEIGAKVICELVLPGGLEGGAARPTIASGPAAEIPTLQLNKTEANCRGCQIPIRLTGHNKTGLCKVCGRSYQQKKTRQKKAGRKFTIPEMDLSVEKWLLERK